MIVFLKMCTANKNFGEIFLKVITDTFFQYAICDQERDMWRKKCGTKMWNIQQKRSQKFWH